ncbi:MAG: SDR family oxidoreductase [Thermodesulfobacteriota bacterium]
MAKLLVTGGAGFIGSNTVDELLNEGHEVRVFDNFVTGKKGNLSQFLREIEVIEGDIRNLDVVRKAVKGMQYVVHLAGLSSVSLSVKDPLNMNEVNITGTLNVFTAARDGGVRRVVYSSSSSVYGDNPTLPKREDMLPEPRSPYAVSKLAGEYYCRVFNQVYGLETVSLRYFNIYGKRQNPFSQYAAVIPSFISAMVNEKRPVIFGDGEQSRDFTFIEDCVQANIKACFAPGIEGKTFNISYGDRVTVNELFRKIRGLLDKDGIEPVYVAPRLGDVKHSLADTSEARALLGFKPNHCIETGLKKALEWYYTNL